MDINGKQVDPEVDKLFTQQMPPTPKASQSLHGGSKSEASLFLSDNSKRALEKIRDLMRDAIQMKKNELPDLTLSKLREEYLKLDWESRQRALLVLATQFGVDRKRVHDLISHYESLSTDGGEESDAAEAARYRTEHDLRSALMPLSARLFEQMNGQAGGLKFLVDLRADLIATVKEKNLAALRALDSELKGMFATWLGPACLELQQITWANSAALLERIVVYEAVHPISNLYDLKRRLGVGRRCYGYFHPAIPGEPLVFIEVALTNEIVGSIQNVLFEEPPIAEEEATTAIFYSISSTQTGLAGIDLGHFLIKRVVRLLRQEIPNIQTFVTLSPIPGFLKWLLPKLKLQIRYAQVGAEDIIEMSDPPSTTFKENLLLPEEESNLVEACGKDKESISGMQILHDLLTSSDHEWAKSAKLVEVLRAPLMRLCARYLIVEKKRGRALDQVTNFHVRNGASVERLNWMGDTSIKGLETSAGIMVNYIYRLENIDTNNQAYLNKGIIAASPAIEQYLQSRL
ncbi:malonyl-CoA decarboxylase [Marchantia polymorpha subsp. ruderalis]|uniref:Malonyl-CoA decarboxylase n=2 Tax=Marchantia polymorpha TaxID=3197 RepID=A0AAF6B813_MARPO|nr:hypothetical protein MARPO_0112s0027 [Marchantia polymorpha]BBN08147.1 hypothetical protein Mp_4g09270 [Marchantia polymorpha subsp. ruderalis]|eukprot:PTQ31373.1 hypothetical protein MARPO_0112s0027 [Marchantia polymorpha]